MSDRVIVKITETEDGVRIILRENDKKFIKEEYFQNYFYIYEDDYSDCEFIISKKLAKTEIVEDRDGVEYRKLYLKTNNSRYFIKTEIEDLGIETFEADITAPKRYLLDNPDLELNQDKLRKVYMDIETADFGALKYDFKGKIVARESITSIACKDFDGKIAYFRNEGLDSPEYDYIREEYREFTRDRSKPVKKETMVIIRERLLAGEHQLLKDYLKFINQYDLVMAWNGKLFDFEYLKQRFKKHNIFQNNFHFVDFDYMDCYKFNKFGTIPDGYGLDNVAKHEFTKEKEKENSEFDNLDEVGKIDWKKLTGLKKYFELFLLEPELHKEYNIQDVHLMKMIEEKVKFLKIHEVLVLKSHTLLYQTLFNSVSIDNRFLGEYKKLNIIAKSKPTRELVDKRKHPITGTHPSGGYTYCFFAGIFDDVSGYDAKSHYPTEIATHNICPTTFVGNHYPNLNLVFKENEVNFINDVCRLAVGKDNSFLKEIPETAKIKYINAKGELSPTKYKKIIDILKERHQVTKTMEELMWQFVDGYKDDSFTNYLEANNLTATDADINMDVRGWGLHPHRIFRREIGVLPRVAKDLLNERDEIKYTLKDYEYGSNKWEEKNCYQNAVKKISNSLFGVFGLKSGREFQYDIADCITSSSRMKTKQSINLIRKINLLVPNGDTDSLYVKGVKNKKEIDILFFDFFNEYLKRYNLPNKFNIKNPRTNEIVETNHWKIFEYEKTFDSVIVVKKKRYYYKIGDKIDAVGGAFMRADTIKIASDLQKELVGDLLNKTYLKENWLLKLLKLKEKVYAGELEFEHIVKSKNIKKPIEDYGKPVIDGATGKPKIRKDGQPQFAPIPAHIALCKKLIEQGQNYGEGDSIQYIVKEHKPKIIPMSVEEYEETKGYSREYYWSSIMSPILEIMRVVEKENIYTYFSECWAYTERQLKRLIKKMEEEEEQVEEKVEEEYVEE